MARRLGGARGNLLLLGATAAALLFIIFLTLTSRPDAASLGVAEQRHQADSGRAAKDTAQVMRDRQLEEILGRVSKPDLEPSQPIDAANKVFDGPVERQAKETGALVIPPPTWKDGEGAEVSKDSGTILSKLVSSARLRTSMGLSAGTRQAAPVGSGEDTIPAALPAKSETLPIRAVDKQSAESEKAGRGEEEEMQEYYDGSMGPRFAPVRPLDGYEDLVFCTIVPELNSTVHLGLLRAFVGVREESRWIFGGRGALTDVSRRARAL